ncbi:MAG: ABC transporter substrate-binding protein [Corynebacterium sp.]|nr:ABC transporter substrate-binding protein [Corynebacterium sp.]
MFKLAAAPAVLTAAALLITGCTNNEATETAAAGGPSSTAQERTIAVDDAAAALVPAEVAESGVLRLGTNPEYSPNEFKDPAGNPTGWDVQLAEAIAMKLGLTPEWEIGTFDSLLPNLAGGNTDMGAASFTVNEERVKSFDFVNYYSAGVLWAQAPGGNVDPANACGLTVGVQMGTFEQTDELPAKSQECVDAGKEPIEILTYDSQNEVANNLALGKIDAFSADSPVTGYAIKQMEGKIEAAGETFDTAPYGYAVAKGSELAPAIQAALASLKADGTYDEILADWGVESGAVSEFPLNAL